ncbi:MAG TPA: phage holin family protein [Myxococcales bacterium]|nr:phage holin family protein [Myxococcales bacterium]
MPSGQMLEPPPPKDALQRLIDGLQTLVREHLALARVEAKEDMRQLGRDALAGAAGLPALAAGYVLFMMAIGFLLSTWIPAWAGFGIIALLNLGAGGAVTFAGLQRLRKDRVQLPATGQELKRNRQWLASMRNGNSHGDGGGNAWQT